MLVSDIEANGLLDTVTQFHCATTIDYFTREEKRYYPWDFSQYVDDLMEYQSRPEGMLVFHNGIGYDYPAIELLAKKLLNRDIKFDQTKCLDTLVMSRLVFSNVGDMDVKLIRSGKLAGAMFGRQSLESWGYRLGQMKGEYMGDPAITDPKERAARKWESYNEEMGDYCVQDVVVTIALLDKIFSDKYYFSEGVDLPFSVKLEHQAAWVLAEMERNGFPFDSKTAEQLYTEMAAERQNMLMTLVNTFGSWYEPEKKPKREAFRHPRTGKPLINYPEVIYPASGDLFLKDGKTLSKTDKFKGAPYTPIKHVTFNPSSRPNILKVLKDAGWIPTEFTDADNAIIDGDTLAEVKVSDPHKQHCVTLISQYLMLQKRIGQLAEGKSAWLAKVQENGRIHGSINPNGAVTGRATHSNPNMGQVPSVSKNKEGYVYGMAGGFKTECRGLFGASYYTDPTTGEPWVQAGVDASGLELRCLGHFMARYDNGKYIDVILNGDIHTINQEAAGLPTRDNAKTFIYGWLYGAGAAKIGEIVGGSATEGKVLIKSFLEKIPAIASLREAITDTLVASSKWVGGQQEVKWKRKWIRGLDGRKVHVRSSHSALNTLLQSAGALICKAWVVEVYRLLTEKYGYVSGFGNDFAYMGWIHRHHCESKTL